MKDKNRTSTNCTKTAKNSLIYDNNIPKKSEKCVRKKNKKVKSRSKLISRLKDKNFGTTKKNKIIYAEFIFNDPSEDDLTGIQNLILNTSRYLPWKSNIDGLCPSLDFISNLISEQANVGTILKTESGEFSCVIGLLSALNFNQYKQMDTIKLALLEECKKHGDTDELERMFINNQIGLIVNERMINAPLELVDKLFANLLLDIEWSLNSDVVPKEEIGYYKYTHFLFITRLLNLKGKTNDKLGFDGFFYKFEEKEFFNQSKIHFAWPSGDMNIYNKKLYPEYNLIFVITFENFQDVIKKLSAMVKLDQSNS
ncbi:p21-C-terminal region-binding protein [Babesia microti strain RI]|uniref:P21-C-terminal region-binding protein n=1 Tax=Babesia microti (strain RI) TaxID=1133968 RepID=A0A1R4A9Z4_BABMR|nr:p21-C-terminal region-binding protein [Babesia microti strain RI]SJK85816.1 p21-C-terminal region-binding protein [Babesia microti strain RI]|eukprot:XP_021338035.1 p21-C-terminal region-binding protein [Babesia microti strain RI]